MIVTNPTQLSKDICTLIRDQGTHTAFKQTYGPAMYMVVTNNFVTPILEAKNPTEIALKMSKKLSLFCSSFI